MLPKESTGFKVMREQEKLGQCQTGLRSDRPGFVKPRTQDRTLAQKRESTKD